MSRIASAGTKMHALAVRRKPAKAAFRAMLIAHPAAGCANFRSCLPASWAVTVRDRQNKTRHRGPVQIAGFAAHAAAAVLAAVAPDAVLSRVVQIDDLGADQVIPQDWVALLPVIAAHLVQGLAHVPG